MDSSLAIINLLPFLLSVLMVIPATRSTLKQSGMTWLATGVMAVTFLWLTTYIPVMQDEPFIEQTWGWVPALGLSLSWYLDGLSLMFALVVSGVGVAVFLYAGYYMDEVDDLARFYMYLGAFAGAMLALVLAGNIITLFIAWELTSITSYMLIGFKGYKDEDARIGASRALVITGGGGLALFLGLLLLGTAAGSFQLHDILEVENLVEHPWYVAFTLLIMLGCFTKSAQFPFHFWLPGAMSAPSPASAYLHSATMVKAGIYLLFRLYEPLHDSLLWQNGLLTIGLTTMLLGALLAVRQYDLKGLLAYSTISKLGAIVALIGIPHEHGLKAASVGILAHALYKATFFLLAGIIDHATGTRDLRKLGGLRKRMPTGAVIATTVGLSMAGFPPLLGFAAKEFLIDEMLPADNGIGYLPVTIVVIASIFTVVAAGIFVWDVFFSRPDTEYEHFHTPERGIYIGPALLGMMSILGGIFISPLFTPIIKPILGDETKLYIIPPEVNTATILSIVVLTMGPVLFLLRRYWLGFPWPPVPTLAEIYAGFIRSIEWAGDQLLRTQNGKLRYYLIVIMASVAGLMVIGGFTSPRPVNITLNGSTDILKITLLVLTVLATLAAIIFRRHLLAAFAMGISGYAIGVLFILEPAPDVALVQLLAETLATVLIILMFARIRLRRREAAMQVLWKGQNEKNNFGIYRDIAISAAIGISVGLFALAAVGERDTRPEVAEPIANWFLENTYEEAEVTDIVAAILADFRGTDTLLEITVFSVAALGVLTLLTLPQGRELLVGHRVTQVMRAVVVADDKAEAPTALQQVEQGAAVVSPQAQTAHPALAETKMGQVVSTNGNYKNGDYRSGLVPDDAEADDYGAFGDANDIPRFSTPITRLAATVVMPFAIIISLAHVFYGADGPGDGFTAGVVSGLAVALWYVVFGYFEARARLWWLRPGRLIVIGLAVALGNALLGHFLDVGFLGILSINEGKGPAGLHLTSSLIFEIAIYVTVFGGTTTIMQAIAYPEDVKEEEELVLNHE